MESTPAQAATGRHAGLSQGEAEARLQTSGFNELPSSGRGNIGSILFRIIQEPMLLLLLACGTVYLVSGEPGDGALLFTSAAFVIALTLYQEVKSERALEALKELSSPRALVIRNGTPRRIPSRELVPGDLIQLGEGDRVPADAVVLSAQHLAVDESILTGESFSVSKREAPSFHLGPLPEADQRLFSGTLVVGGQGKAIVISTGPSTEFGRIGRTLEQIQDEPTPLQREIRKLVRLFGTLGVLFSLVVTLVYGLTRGAWSQGILAGLAAAMSLLPEEFPVVMTVFMALGAWRLGRKNVLTRHAAAIEALGSISVLCVDKTGTLTENRMSVRLLWDGNQERDLQAPWPADGRSFERLMVTAALACPPTPFDPMEKAILAAGSGLISGLDSRQLISQYPLSPGLLAMSCVWKTTGEEPLRVASKGAPEAIVGLCDMNRAERKLILEQVGRLASRGLRILGVAEARFSGPKESLPGDQSDFDWTFLGLFALEDPVRPEVPQLIQECGRAGIRVLMLTGDSPETAGSIARQIGLSERVLTGREISRLDDLRLASAVREVVVFARVSPEQKLRIVTALKACGERVAMTGDGVNDASSLKAADIGIAMGGRGTDVAREASDLVLLDDSFHSMVAGIHQGRRIYENLRKAIFYLLAIHVPIAGLTILPVLLKLPLVLFPAHIVFLELIIDPACSLVYESEEDEEGLMARPPRPLHVPLLQLRALLRTLLQGAAILALVFGLFLALLGLGRSEDQARSAAFVSLILSNLGLILVNRSSTGGPFAALRRRNAAFNWIAGGALALLGLVLVTPPARSLFDLARPSATDITLALGAAILSLGLSSLFRVSVVSKTAQAA